jgi:hypothetical protein
MILEIIVIISDSVTRKSIEKERERERERGREKEFTHKSQTQIIISHFRKECRKKNPR